MDDVDARSQTPPESLPPLRGNSEHEQPAPRSSEGAKMPTVLIVDDEVAMLELGCDYLKQQGYMVLPASLPSKAIEIAMAHKGVIDLLITDIIMPEMNGQELADTIAHISPDTKTLFMSGYTSKALIQEILTNANFHFIAKPFSLKNFKEKIKKLIFSY